MRRLVTYGCDDTSPVARTVDLLSRMPRGLWHAPLFASLAYWVRTPDVPADPEAPGGGVDLTLWWDDTVGQSRALGGQSLSLRDGAAFIAYPLQILPRRWDAPIVLTWGVSNPGNARVGYSVVLLPSLLSDVVDCSS